MGGAVRLTRCRRRRAALAATLAIGSLSFGAARPAAAELFLAGTCTLTLKANYSPDIAVTPNDFVEIHVSDAGDGSCLTTSGPATIGISGSLATPPIIGSWGCVSGIATGRLTVEIGVPGFPDPTVNAAVVNVAGTMHLVMSSDNPVVFDGVANLVQDPFKTAECVTNGSIGRADWFGTVTFQDPVLPSA